MRDTRPDKLRRRAEELGQGRRGDGGGEYCDTAAEGFYQQLHKRLLHVTSRTPGTLTLAAAALRKPRQQAA